MLLPLLISVVVVYLTIRIIKSYRYRQTLNKIPAPPGHWLLGNMDYFIKEYTGPGHLFIKTRQWNENHWPIHRFSCPWVVAINLLHPKDFEIVLSQMKHLTKSEIYSLLEGWLGTGLLTSTGSKWQTRRKILTQAFHFNILQEFLKVFNEETANLVKQIETINAQNKKLEAVDILPLITHMTLQSISETAMGIRNIDEKSQTEYKNMVYKMGQIFVRKLAQPWTRFGFIYWLTNGGREEKVLLNGLHEFTSRVIKEREKQLLNQKHETLVSTSYSGRKIMKMLDLLLLAKVNENSIDFEGIREEVDTFMFEGHDTTAAAISFLIFCLAKHPEIQEEVRKEIRDVLGSNTDPTYTDLQELTYTERVIKETLRLYPSVPFISRVSSEDFVTHTGYFIPKDTIIHMHIFDLHRDPRIYPDPLKFDPDRFLPENANDRHPFAYLPFSAGPRNCIGQKYAILEIKSVIAGILRKFRLEEGTKEVNFLSDLVLRVDGEIRVKFVPL